MRDNFEEDYEWDGTTLFNHDDLLAANPLLAFLDEFDEEDDELLEPFSEESEAAKGGAKTPAEPNERKSGSDKNKAGSASKNGSEIEFSESVVKSLKNKVEEHNKKNKKKVTLSQLKKVYRRGAGAFSTSHRPGQTRGSWAMARVNMFLKMVRGEKVKDSYKSADGDLI